MSRTARIKSETGIYHVMLRGNNKQIVFFNSGDYCKFLKILRECKVKDGFELYAYCLMPNHIHLLLKTADAPLGDVMRRIATKFAIWYNIKHDRIGHLFQDRFKSEPVNDESYFCTVMRYIHMNPVKAGLCKDLEDYPYSSYVQYLDQSEWVDSAFFLDRFGLKGFEQFHQETCEDVCMDISTQTKRRLCDEEVASLIKEVTGCADIDEFQALNRSKQQKCICDLFHRGASIRQLSHLTRIPIRTVQNYCK